MCTRTAPPLWNYLALGSSCLLRAGAQPGAATGQQCHPGCRQGDEAQGWHPACGGPVRRHRCRNRRCRTAPPVLLTFNCCSVPCSLKSFQSPWRREALHWTGSH